MRGGPPVAGPVEPRLPSTPRERGVDVVVAYHSGAQDLQPPCGVTSSVIAGGVKPSIQPPLTRGADRGFGGSTYTRHFPSPRMRGAPREVAAAGELKPSTPERGAPQEDAVVR